MAAPSLAALLNFDAQLTFAARGILASGGFHGTWQRGAEGVRPNAAVAVTVDIGEAGNRLGLRPEGTTEQAQYTATLSVMVAVERTNNTPETNAAGTPLDADCAKIRALFLNHPNPFCAYQDAQGVYIQINAIRPLASQYEVGEDSAVDARILSWEIQFLIPDSAWPSVS